MRLTNIALTLGLSATLAANAQIKHIQSEAQDQQAVNITVYNNNLALVKDNRSVYLPVGELELSLKDVSASMRAETVVLGYDDSDLKILEQNFDYDLLTPDSLLAKYIGETIRVQSTHPVTGDVLIETAKLLAKDQHGVVLQFADRIAAGKDTYTYLFDQLPDNLRDRPTLTVQLENSSEGKRDLALSYLTSGLSWNADYVAQLNETEDLLTINGWVTLENNSGSAFSNVRLQLVAGDVNIVQPVIEYRNRNEVAFAPVAVDSVAESGIGQESLFDYHLYTLDRNTNIDNLQTKQLALMNADQVPVKKQYVLTGGGHYNFSKDPSGKRKRPVQVWFEFLNTEENNLGTPLPGGVMRVYKRDQEQRTQFIGENRVDHTPKGQTVRLNIGESFDVKAERWQSDFVLISSDGRSSLSEVENTVLLTNAKDHPVEVIVREVMYGDWEILQQSSSYTKNDGDLVEWTVTVPADSEITHTYRVRVRD